MRQPTGELGECLRTYRLPSASTGLLCSLGRRADSRDPSALLLFPLLDGTVLVKSCGTSADALAEPTTQLLISFRVAALCWFPQMETLFVCGRPPGRTDAADECWIARGQRAALDWRLEPLSVPAEARQLSLECWAPFECSQPHSFLVPFTGLPALGLLQFDFPPLLPPTGPTGSAGNGAPQKYVTRRSNDRTPLLPADPSGNTLIHDTSSPFRH